jgi:hypothetical protein
MKRTLISIVLSLCVILVFIAGGIWTQRASLVSYYLTNATGMPVHVKKVSLSGGRVLTLSQVEVKSLKGAVFPQSLFIQELQVQFNAKSLFEKVIHLYEVKLDHAVISLEVFNVRGDLNNWIRLLRNFPMEGETYLSQDEEDEDPIWRNREKGIRIHRLVMQDVQCEILDKSSRKEFITLIKIPELLFEDLGKREPLDLKFSFRLLVDPLLMYVSKRPHLSQVYHHVPELPPKLLQELYPQVENFFLRQESRNLDLQRKFYLADQSLDREHERLQERYERMQKLLEDYLSEGEDISLN